MRRAGLAAILMLVGLASGSSANLTGLPAYGPGPHPVLLQFARPGVTSPTASGDFNCDGIVDVVVPRGTDASPGTEDVTYPLVILLGDGRGGFRDGTAALFVGAPPRIQGVGPTGIIVADFNGDGRPDVFLADGGSDIVDVWPGYQNSIALSTDDCRLRDGTADLPRQRDFTHSAAAADIDGDGDLDLYIGNVSGREGVPPQIWLNDGAGRFTIAAGRLPAEQEDLGNGAYTSSEFVDVNGDGSPDLVLGGFCEWFHDPPSIVLLNDGTGHFTRRDGAMPRAPGSFACAVVQDIQPIDLNGDGAPDLILSLTSGPPTPYQGQWLQLLVNDGDGTFRDETATRLPQVDNEVPAPSRITLLDVNGDGHLDFGIEQGSPFPGPSPFFVNDGAGRFTVTAFPNLFTGWRPVDVDGDGGRDILTTGGGPIEFHVLLRDTSAAVRPAAPRGLTGSTRRIGGRVRLGWAYVWGATSYEVWRADGPGGRMLRVGRTGRLEWESPVAGHYAVRAVGRAGAGPMSASIAVAGSRADVTVDSVVLAAGPMPGTTTATYTLRNRGGDASAASEVRVYLSLAGERGPRARVHRQPALAPGATTMNAVTLPRVPANRYRVLVCANDRARAVDVDPRNDCALSPTRIGG